MKNTAIQDNKILTDLQKQVMTSLFNLTDKFYLTGGTALSAFYLEHRYSMDLDFFTKDKTVFNEAKMIIAEVCSKINKDMRVENNTFYFKHFDVTDKERDKKLTLHFSLDITEQIKKEKNRFGNIIVDPVEEILVNKICAVAGRSEVKDLIDLYFLEKEGYDINSYIPYAQIKDGGIENEVVAYCLNNILTACNENMLIKKVTEKQLSEFKERLIKELVIR